MYIEFLICQVNKGYISLLHTISSYIGGRIIPVNSWPRTVHVYVQITTLTPCSTFLAVAGASTAAMAT